MDRYYEKIMKSREAEAEIKALLRRKRMQELAILRKENEQFKDENELLRRQIIQLRRERE